MSEEIRSETPVIADSGERREFVSGAVRDMSEGKGRCDLLPLDVAAGCLDERAVLSIIADFMEMQDENILQYALQAFRTERGWDAATMILEVAVHAENGAKKYGERNWEKGIPTHSYVDSAVRHYLKWKRGDEDERHDRAFCWNVLALMWTMKHKAEYNDLPQMEGDGK